MLPTVDAIVNEKWKFESDAKADDTTALDEADDNVGFDSISDPNQSHVCIIVIADVKI